MFSKNIAKSPPSPLMSCILSAGSIRVFKMWWPMNNEGCKGSISIRYRLVVSYASVSVQRVKVPVQTEVPLGDI